MEKYTFNVEENEAGFRIDKYLIGKLENKSRSSIQNIIEDENCTVNGKIVKSSYKLKIEDKVELTFPEPVNLQVVPEDIPIDILFEDKDIIVVNKPQGMVVHPASGNYTGTLVNAILNHCKDLSGINGVIRPGIVHRIDKDTSGVLVIAKNDNAHIELSKQLKEHSMTRVYYAIVEGVIKQEDGIVDAPLARSPQDRKKIAVIKDGRRAVTHYRVKERFKNTTFIECRLETGRTHQIRVHMSHIGHPLVGDPVYGFKKQKYNLQGQLLHAKVLGFKHPATKEYMEFESPLPAHFKKMLDILRNELK